MIDVFVFIDVTQKSHPFRIKLDASPQTIKLNSIMSNMKKTNCDSDPLPMSVIYQRGNFLEFMKIILKIVNMSISFKVFPTSEKLALIKPIVKGVLDSQSFASYRPVSNLTFLSKMLE